MERKQRDKRVKALPISGEHPIMMEKSALAGEGDGVHAHSLSAYYHHVRTKKIIEKKYWQEKEDQLERRSYQVAVYAPAEWADTLTLFHLYQYIYSVVETDLVFPVGVVPPEPGFRPSRLARWPSSASSRLLGA